MASNSVFGEPCEGTFKYLMVYYTCQPIGKIELMLSGFSEPLNQHIKDMRVSVVNFVTRTSYNVYIQNVCIPVNTLPTVTTETTTTKVTTTIPPRPVCDALYFEGKNWPYTKAGDVATVSCNPPKVGRMTWKCTGPNWFGERPDDSECRRPVTG